MRVLVIGGTGLMSTEIVRQLLERGDEVTVCNRGASGRQPPAGVRQIVADRREPKTFEALMAANGTWDCVIDMVCFVPEEARSAVRAFGFLPREEQ